MRIWSIHPKCLDTKGLVALWRETLLAKKVLAGKTKAYRNHPQLNRFKEMIDPEGGVDHYLSYIYEEAKRRNYNFNREKINWDFEFMGLAVTKGQIQFEARHLLAKLKKRDPGRFQSLSLLDHFDPHPIFQVVDGPIEDWERI